MAIVVRINDADQTWQCVNRVAHITVGTRDNSVKPKESNDLLTHWLEAGVTDGMHEIVFEEKVNVNCVVKGVLSR